MYLRANDTKGTRSSAHFYSQHLRDSISNHVNNHSQQTKVAPSISHVVDQVTLTSYTQSHVSNSLNQTNARLAYAVAKGDQLAISREQQTKTNLLTLQGQSKPKIEALAAVDSGGSSNNDYYLPDSELPSGIQAEIHHLGDLWNKTDDQNSRNQLHQTANELRKIGTNGDNYEVVRINTFIPSSKVQDPRYLPYTYHGDGRGFDPDSTDSRTSQVIAVDLNTLEAVGANYTGKTYKYNQDGSVNEAKREPVDGHMDIQVTQESNDVKISATVNSSNPTVWGSPPIENNVTFTVDSNGNLNGAGVSKIFPANEMYVEKDGGDYTTLHQFMPNMDPSLVRPAAQLLSPDRDEYGVSYSPIGDTDEAQQKPSSHPPVSRSHQV